MTYYTGEIVGDRFDILYWRDNWRQIWHIILEIFGDRFDILYWEKVWNIKERKIEKWNTRGQMRLKESRRYLKNMKFWIKIFWKRLRFLYIFRRKNKVKKFWKFRERIEIKQTNELQWEPENFRIERRHKNQYFIWFYVVSKRIHLLVIA